MHAPTLFSVFLALLLSLSFGTSLPSSEALLSSDSPFLAKSKVAGGSKWKNPFARKPKVHPLGLLPDKRSVVHLRLQTISMSGDSTSYLKVYKVDGKDGGAKPKIPDPEGKDSGKPHLQYQAIPSTVESSTPEGKSGTPLDTGVMMRVKPRALPADCVELYMPQGEKAERLAGTSVSSYELPEDHFTVTFKAGKFECIAHESQKGETADIHFGKSLLIHCDYDSGLVLYGTRYSVLVFRARSGEVVIRLGQGGVRDVDIAILKAATSLSYDVIGTVTLDEALLALVAGMIYQLVLPEKTVEPEPTKKGSGLL